MLEVAINEDLGVHALGYALVDVQANRITGNIGMLQAEVFKDRFTGAEDMAFLFILGVVVMRQGILQTAQLLVGIAAESVDGSLGKEQLFIIDKHLTCRSDIEILVRLVAKKLDGVGVAGEQQADEFIETINRGVGNGIHALLEVGEA